MHFLSFDIDQTQIPTNKDLNVMDHFSQLTRFGYLQPTQELLVDAVLDAYALKKLCEQAQEQGDMLFTHNSGRVLGRILPTLQSRQYNMEGSVLTDADAIISGIGTEIHMAKRGSGEIKYPVMRAWQNRLSAKYNEMTKINISEIARSHIEMTPQEDHKNNEFKTSFYIGADKPVKERLELAKNFEAALTGNINNLNVTVSHLDDTRGAFIDVTPASAGKANAIKFLMDLFDIDGESLIVAGDTMNDLPMFLLAAETGGRGIVPANGSELAREIKTNPVFDPSRFYLCKKNICASGVLEGLAHMDVFDLDDVGMARLQANAEHTNYRL